MRQEVKRDDLHLGFNRIPYDFVFEGDEGNASDFIFLTCENHVIVTGQEWFHALTYKQRRKIWERVNEEERKNGDSNENSKGVE